MGDFLILGTDTDAGKTTFALLWMAAFADRYEYWKPIETGESDSQRVASLVPAARVHASLLRLQEAVAPLLAARKEGAVVPAASAIAAAKPSPGSPGHQVLIETFGGPFSPLNDAELQIALVQALALPTILVSPSAVGAIGRILQSLQALDTYQVRPKAVVLMGQPDPFAVEQISHYGLPGRIFSLCPPTAWDVAGIVRAAQAQTAVLETIGRTIDTSHAVTPSSLIPHPSSLIPHPSSLIPHPSSLIPHPSSLIPHPSSLAYPISSSETVVTSGIPTPRSRTQILPWSQWQPRTNSSASTMGGV